MITLALAVFLAAGARADTPVPTPSSADFERFSVLTSPGPDEPPPELFVRSHRLLYAYHRVGKEEATLADIAKKYGTSVPGLQTTNNNEFFQLHDRDRQIRMLVTNRDGQLYEVRRDSETLDAIVARFWKGAEQQRRAKDLIVRVNNLPGLALLTPYELDRGDKLLVPGVRVNFDTYRFPFESQARPRISSGFGFRFHPVLRKRKQHEGLDIPQPYGTPVYPSRSGVVVGAGWHEGYGKLIEIRHKNGETTRYGHLSEIYVKPGDVVQRTRTMIGRVGSTGISTGPHLHFEVRDKRGRPVDPNRKIGH